jgi:hypothetical protein
VAASPAAISHYTKQIIVAVHQSVSKNMTKRTIAFRAGIQKIYKDLISFL